MTPGQGYSNSDHTQPSHTQREDDPGGAAGQGDPADQVDHAAAAAVDSDQPPAGDPDAQARVEDAAAEADMAAHERLADEGGPAGDADAQRAPAIPAASTAPVVAPAPSPVPVSGAPPADDDANPLTPIEQVPAAPGEPQL